MLSDTNPVKVYPCHYVVGISENLYFNRVEEKLKQLE